MGYGNRLRNRIGSSIRVLDFMRTKVHTKCKIFGHNKHHSHLPKPNLDK